MSWLSRLLTPREGPEEPGLREVIANLGATPVEAAQVRAEVTVAGVIAETSPGDAASGLHVRLTDDTGTMGLVFLGRQEVPGIEEGRWIAATGRVAESGGQRVIFNPRYELLTGGTRMRKQGEGRRLEGAPVDGNQPPTDGEETAPALPTPSGAFAQLAAEDFDVMASMGGVRGLLESVIPGLVFVVVFIATRELVPALIAASAVAVVALAARLLVRQSPAMAFGGFVGVMIGVIWAWRSGDAGDFFVWGLYVNAAYAIGVLISILARWPIVGVLVALLRNTWDSWRSSPAYPRYVAATWIWVGLFALRLAVQLPLYLTGQVGWLGTARLVMGVPLFALVLWVTWLLVREPAGREAPEGTPRP
ncbi:MAG: DUF3159 domain-containing protein [bacterium]|nr:DUF3159 domain-containing protein [bacterium]